MLDTHLKERKVPALDKFLKSNTEGRRSLSQPTAARLKEAGKK